MFYKIEIVQMSGRSLNRNDVTVSGSWKTGLGRSINRQGGVMPCRRDWKRKQGIQSGSHIRRFIWIKCGNRNGVAK